MERDWVPLSIRESGTLATRLWEAPGTLPADVRAVVALKAERDRLREALERLGGYDGPLYLLEPSQGERPDPTAAGHLLREIITSALSPESNPPEDTA